MSLPESRLMPGVPMRLSAPAAIRRHALSDRGCRAIGWQWDKGRAIYTNVGTGSELIQPLGVTLAGAKALSVTGDPGEKAY